VTGRRLTVAAAALAVIGAAIAGYLTWVHYAELEPFCVGGGAACERVQSSRYADLADVPVAVLGLAGYLAILGALVLPGATGRSAAAFAAVVMTLLAVVTVARMVAADMNLESTRT
jgi:uncharacterized membrane protein